MKNSKSDQTTVSRSSSGRFRTGYACLTLAVGMFAVAWLRWSSAQEQAAPETARETARLGEPEESAHERTERELSRRAILNPTAHELENERVRTAEQKQARETALFAITQPGIYAAEYARFQTPDQKAWQVEARAAILNPLAHSGSAEEVRQRHLRDKQAGQPEHGDIFDPQFQSSNVPGLPLLKAAVPRAH